MAEFDWYWRLLKSKKNILIAETHIVYSFKTYLALFQAYLGSPPRKPRYERKIENLSDA